MKTNTKTNKTSALFNDDIELIDCIASLVNIVHKKSVTPKINNNKSLLKNRKFRIAQDKNHLDIDCRLAVGLIWSDDTIDKAFSKYKKLFSECVIVEVIPQPHNNALSLV